MSSNLTCHVQPDPLAGPLGFMPEWLQIKVTDFRERYRQQVVLLNWLRIVATHLTRATREEIKEAPMYRELVGILKKLTCLDSCTPIPLRNQLTQTWLAYLARVDNAELFSITSWFLDQLRPIVNTGNLIVLAYPPQTSVLIHSIGSIFFRHRGVLLALASDAVTSILKGAQANLAPGNLALIRTSLHSLERLTRFSLSTMIDAEQGKTLLTKVIKPFILDTEANRLIAAKILLNVSLHHPTIVVEKSLQKSIRQRLVTVLESDLNLLESDVMIFSQLIAALILPSAKPYNKGTITSVLASIKKHLKAKERTRRTTYLKIFQEIIYHFDPLLLLECIFEWIRPSLGKNLQPSSDCLDLELVEPILISTIYRCGAEHYLDFSNKLLQNGLDLFKQSVLLEPYLARYLNVYLHLIKHDESLMPIGSLEELTKLCIDYASAESLAETISQIVVGSCNGRIAFLLDFTKLIFELLANNNLANDQATLPPTTVNSRLGAILISLLDHFIRINDPLKQFYTPYGLIKSIKTWCFDLLQLETPMIDKGIVWRLIFECELVTPGLVNIDEAADNIIKQFGTGNSVTIISIISRVIDSIVISAPQKAQLISKLESIIADKVEELIKLDAKLIITSLIHDLFSIWNFIQESAHQLSKNIRMARDFASLALKLFSTDAIAGESYTVVANSYCRFLVKSCSEHLKYNISQINLNAATGSSSNLFSFTCLLVATLKPTDIPIESASFYLESFQKIISPFLSNLSMEFQEQAACALGNIAGLTKDTEFKTQLLKELMDQALHISDPNKRYGYIIAIGHVFVNIGLVSTTNTIHANILDSSTIVGVLLSIARDGRSLTSQIAAIRALTVVIEQGSTLLGQHLINELMFFNWDAFVSPTIEQPRFKLAWSKLFLALLGIIGPELKLPDNRWRAGCFLQTASLLESTIESSYLLEDALKTSLHLLLSTQQTLSIEYLFIAIKNAFRITNTSSFIETIAIKAVAVSCIRWLYEFNPEVAPVVLKVFVLDLIQLIGILSKHQNSESVIAAKDTTILVQSIFAQTIRRADCQLIWLRILQVTFPSSSILMAGRLLDTNGIIESKQAINQAQPIDIDYSREGLLEDIDNASSSKITLPIMDLASVKFVTFLFSRWLERIVNNDSSSNKREEKALAIIRAFGSFTNALAFSQELVRLAMSLITIGHQSPHENQFKMLGIDIVQLFLLYFAPLVDVETGDLLVSGFHSQVVTIFNTGCGNNCNLVIRAYTYQALLASHSRPSKYNDPELDKLFMSTKFERLVERSLANLLQLEKSSFDLVPTNDSTEMCGLVEKLAWIDILFGWSVYSQTRYFQRLVLKGTERFDRLIQNWASLIKQVGRQVVINSNFTKMNADIPLVVDGSVIPSLKQFASVSKAWLGVIEERNDDLEYVDDVAIASLVLATCILPGHCIVEIIDVIRLFFQLKPFRSLLLAHLYTIIEWIMSIVSLAIGAIDEQPVMFEKVLYLIIDILSIEGELETLANHRPDTLDRIESVLCQGCLNVKHSNLFNFNVLLSALCKFSQFRADISWILFKRLVYDIVCCFKGSLPFNEALLLCKHACSMTNFINAERYSELSLLVSAGVHESTRNFLLAQKSMELVSTASRRIALLQILTVMVTSRPELMFHFPLDMYLDLLSESISGRSCIKETISIGLIESGLECWILLIAKAKSIRDKQLQHTFISLLIFPAIPFIIDAVNMSINESKNVQSIINLVSKGITLLKSLDEQEKSFPRHQTQKDLYSIENVLLGMAMYSKCKQEDILNKDMSDSVPDSHQAWKQLYSHISFPPTLYS